MLREIGQRIQRERLNRNLTQAELARKAGVSRKTITNLETGDGCSLITLLAVLQAMDRLDHFDAFLPDPGLSPIDLAKLHGKVRQRATGKRKTKTRTEATTQKKKNVTYYYPDTEPKEPAKVAEDSEVWNWAEADD